jgi:hypothetical protein
MLAGNWRGRRRWLVAGSIDGPRSQRHGCGDASPAHGAQRQYALGSGVLLADRRLFRGRISAVVIEGGLRLSATAGRLTEYQDFTFSWPTGGTCA